MSLGVLAIPGLDNSERLREARKKSLEDSMRRFEMQRMARETLRKATLVMAVKR